MHKVLKWYYKQAGIAMVDSDGKDRNVVMGSHVQMIDAPAQDQLHDQCFWRPVVLPHLRGIAGALRLSGAAAWAGNKGGSGEPENMGGDNLFVIMRVYMQLYWYIYIYILYMNI